MKIEVKDYYQMIRAKKGNDKLTPEERSARAKKAVNARIKKYKQKVKISIDENHAV